MSRFASIIAVVALAGCGGEWFGAPPRPVSAPRLTVAEACAPLSAEDRSMSYDAHSLVPICRDVYADPAASPAARRQMQLAVANAVRRDLDFYGALHVERPLIIFCSTDPCRLYYAGPAMRSWNLGPGDSTRGGRYVSEGRHTIVLVRTDDVSENVLTHEISHLELQHRIRRGEVAAWFNEGVATLVSGEPACDGVFAHGVAHLGDLAENSAWASYTDRPGALVPTYCQARAEVRAWVERNGRPTLMALLERVRHGESFETVFGPLLTE